MVHCSSQLGYLYSIFDFHLALSNYSISYNLAKRIGFWDTCKDAIA